LRSVDRVLYAMKANPNPDILREFAALGLGFECVSQGEIERVLEAVPHIERDRLLFTPNFAPRSEYEWALAERIRLTLDNLHPLVHWSELFAARDVFLRIDTGYGRGHHDHVRTAGTHTKFGIPMFELDEAARLAAAAGARVVGLHAHTGSGILDVENWREVAELLGRLVDRFPEVRVIDLGGGLGVPERHGQPALDLNRLDGVLADVKGHLGDIELWLEPGRYLVAEAGVLLARVT